MQSEKISVETNGLDKTLDDQKKLWGNYEKDPRSIETIDIPDGGCDVDDNALEITMLSTLIARGNPSGEDIKPISRRVLWKSSLFAREQTDKHVIILIDAKQPLAIRFPNKETFLRYIGLLGETLEFYDKDWFKSVWDSTIDFMSENKPSVFIYSPPAVVVDEKDIPLLPDINYAVISSTGINAGALRGELEKLEAWEKDNLDE